jgi:putative ABC transport system permease protein
MRAEYYDLSYTQVGLATMLILLNGLISVLLRLGLERALFLAAFRAVVQLLLIGLVLKWIFALSQWYLVAALLMVMTFIAGISAAGRSSHRYRGMHIDSIISVWASSWAVAAIAIFTIIEVEPWYRPQYTIPILGMILGNSLSGISLVLDRLTQELVSKRDEVEGLLVLGASKWEAAQPAIRQAVRAAMIPTINSMMIVGIVSLPGMMTGQLLAGVDPSQTVKYQIAIIFLIASSTALAAIGAVLLAYRRLFNSHHQYDHRLIMTGAQEKSPTMRKDQFQ